MIRCTAVFVTSVAVLISVGSWAPAQARAVELQKVEPNAPEPNIPEPPAVEPETSEPNNAQLEVADFNTVKVAIAEPNRVEAKITDPNSVKLKVVDANTTEPNKAPVIQKVSFHDKCAHILNNFVDEKGMVNYTKLKRKRSELKKVIDAFAQLDPNEYGRWPKEDKIAFWINAYNIQKLRTIVDNYPIQSTMIGRILWGPSSIRNIDKNIGGIDKQKFIIMDEEFTFTQLDRRFFRKEFDEPRVFLALSHASASSPPLRNEPYYGHKLSSQLDDQAKRFLASPDAFSIDRKKKTVRLPAILHPTWYGKQFVAKYGTDKKFKDQQPETRAVLNFITNHISRSDVSFLRLENYSIKYISYNWRINDTTR